MNFWMKSHQSRSVSCTLFLDRSINHIKSGNATTVLCTVHFGFVSPSFLSGCGGLNSAIYTLLLYVYLIIVLLLFGLIIVLFGLKRKAFNLTIWFREPFFFFFSKFWTVITVLRALALENSNAILFYNSKKTLYHYTVPFYNTSASQTSTSLFYLLK